QGYGMRIDKLTSRLQSALADAQSLAVGKDNNFIEPLHVMQALMDQQGSSIKPLLRQAGVDVQRLRQAIGQAIDNLPQVQGNAGEVHLSNELGRLFNVADKLAQQHKDQFISSELLWLAFLEDKGALGQLLKEHRVERKALEKAIATVRGGESVNDAG